MRTQTRRVHGYRLTTMVGVEDWDTSRWLDLHRERGTDRIMVLHAAGPEMLVVTLSACVLHRSDVWWLTQSYDAEGYRLEADGAETLTEAMTMHARMAAPLVARLEALELAGQDGIAPAFLGGAL
ncbi:hypothetical protein ACFQ36_07080 [Arthrobacter sp. GCM10027362]|uniref:hypothetical protein n=1 Tax=Arthrobacter sp. GCM10027362 TaxID=3273379 RepID=UPI003626AD87